MPVAEQQAIERTSNMQPTDVEGNKVACRNRVDHRTTRNHRNTNPACHKLLDDLGSIDCDRPVRFDSDRAERVEYNGSCPGRWLAKNEPLALERSGRQWAAPLPGGQRMRRRRDHDHLIHAPPLKVNALI